MQIFVRNLLSGKPKTMTLTVSSSDTIAAVTAQLHARLGFPPAMQLLYATTTGAAAAAAALRHDAAGTLADHGLREGSVLHLHGSAAGWRAFKADTLRALGIDVAAASGEKRVMRVLVRDHLDPAGRGRAVVLEVAAGDTVAGVMAQVEEKLGYPPELQRLVHDGEELCRESGWTLAEQYVCDGAVLELDMSFAGAVAAIAEVEARNKLKEREESEGVEHVQQQELTGDKTAAQE